MFCDLINEKYGNSIRWFCEARVDILSDILEILPLMKKAGLARIQLGGESGCQQVLDKYGKGTTVEQIRKVTKAIIDAGIPSIYINFIIGGADETEESYSQTLEFAKELMLINPGVVEVGASYYSPSAGSPMYLMPEKYGIKIIDKELVSGSDCNFVFAETNTLNKYRIVQLKTYFDNEIQQMYDDLVHNISKDFIHEIFKLYREYGITTFWRDHIMKFENYNNYFDSISTGAFTSFQNLLENEIRVAIPARTSQLVSNGEMYSRKIRNGTYIQNDEIENAVLTLSSGKLSFSEIYDILINKDLIDSTNGYSQLCEMYKHFDNELVVVWRNKF